MRDKPAPVGASWYTNLSDFQVQAVEALAFSIRDDHAEGTVYRTQFCLSRLGVTPMVKTRMLRKLIGICRGSDLAFLYFLLEACYKGAGAVYSEQILMSAITYLDLEMTMRELDKILPPGVERLNKKESIAPAVEYRSISIPTPSSTRRSSDPQKVRSPYFTSLPKPKIPKGGDKFTAKRPCHVVSFPFWPAGERPNYKVNEENRWFAAYRFQPVKRMLFKMVGDIMTDYWAKIEGAQPAENEDMPICEFHKEARRQEQLVKDAAVVKAHKQCLALVDITSRQDALLRKRIVAQLERDIEEFTLRWKRLRERHHTDVMLVEDHDQICSVGKVPTAVQEIKVKYLSQEADIGRLSAKPTLGVHVITGRGNVSRLSKVRVSDPDDEITCPTLPEEGKLSKCPPSILGHIKRPRKVSITQSKFGEEKQSTCKKSSKPGRFFVGPQQHGPFVFNYHAIAPQDQSPVPRDVMRAQAIRSLKEQSCPSSEDGYNGRINPRDQLVAAIVECAQNMWFGSLEAHQRRQSAGQSENPITFQEPAKNEPEQICKTQEAMDWTKNIKKFDPNNQHLMERLLRDGLSVLRKDPRCVFAAFPDSHKSFVMLEWIKRRYGKTYCHEEIVDQIEKGLTTFMKVENQLNEAPSAKREGFSAKDTFDDFKRLQALANKIKAEYRMPFNDKILNLTRICWSALSPHLARSSSMLKTFFAYLPVRYADMLK
ncbi:uncharacterized protein LOC6536753 [Drosophila yakuba]|uniref:Uncharacterized protein n=1 Tax=Drosophila yakuba TaxID=7245 RepID=B4PNM2_DROYA|nr:uncharacterized protein LOC6536753 [Drosophila yakuba]EDW97037.1 uncharacterized protein Dyak_GE26157 [Drosophila yakuba]